MPEYQKTAPSNYLKLPAPPVESFLFLEKRADETLEIKIQTERLGISPVSMTDSDDYFKFLFSNPKVMEKFGSGEVRTPTFVEDLISKWIKRWESGDPFGAFVIRLHTGEFAGHIVLGHGDWPGHSELAYLIRYEFWGKGYGTEAAQGIVQHLAPMLRAYGYTVDGKSFSYIDATARPDNPASVKILEQLGMHEFTSSEKFGAFRKHFRIPVPHPSPDTSWEILALADRTIARESLR
jgi:RimJ/RimL family protein N-acetyltransferase